MTILVGQFFSMKTTGHKYQIFDIVGKGTGPVPSEAPIVFLKLTTKAGFLTNPQPFVTISERELLNYFSPLPAGK